MKVFVSHSVQDQSFCRLLVKELKKRGLNTWFSSENLIVGTPLSQQIDKGIRDSDIAIVVASPHYFDSSYTRKELDTLHAEEGNGHIKVLIPIWHYIDPKTDLVDSPMLSNKWGPHSHEGIKNICDKIEQVTKGKEIIQKASLRHLWAIIFFLLFISVASFQILQNDCPVGHEYIIERFLCAAFLSISFALFIRKKKRKYYPSARVYGLLFFIALYMLDPMRYLANRYCHNYYLKGSFSELFLLATNNIHMPELSYVQEQIEQRIEHIDQHTLAIQQQEKLSAYGHGGFAYKASEWYYNDDPENLTHRFVHLPEKKVLYEQNLVKNELSELLKQFEKEHWEPLKEHQNAMQNTTPLGFKNQQTLQYYIEECYALPDRSIVVKIRFSNPNRFFLIEKNGNDDINTFMYGLNEIEEYCIKYQKDVWTFTAFNSSDPKN